MIAGWSFLISKSGFFFIRGFSDIVELEIWCFIIRGFSEIVELRGGISRPYFVPFILKGFEYSFFVFVFQDLNFVGGVGSVEGMAHFVTIDRLTNQNFRRYIDRLS